MLQHLEDARDEDIVQPGTGDPVPEGDVGEVVVTTFNRAYPLVRFGTGDMSAVLSGPSPIAKSRSAGTPAATSRAFTVAERLSESA